MSTFPETVKSVLQSIISDLLKSPKEYARTPTSDFTRNNGLLPVNKLIHLILGMRKDTIATETVVDWAVSQGIVNGYNDGTFRPQGSATRAEVAKMLMVFCIVSEG